MAEAVVSSLLPVIFEKLTSSALKSIARYKGIDGEIKKWHRSLTQIQDVLTDASQKEITSQSVKRWLNDLQHLAYDIDDVLDDLATDAMDREFNRESEATTSMVRKLIPTCCTNFSRNTKMLDKLDNINAKLQELLKEKVDLGLSVKEETRSKNINRKLQTSMVHASSIVGREAEKKALVHKLLCDEPNDQNFRIVPIFGMGGVGKTTLARLLYDEQVVKDRFELKAWVCVSDDFDSFGISKVIFQSVTGVNQEFADLNLLQVALREQLKEKRFLLVLDDVWSESCEDWETLVGPFYTCATGSKIIITTRKDKLLKRLGYSNLNQLGSLSHDVALSLLAFYALGVNSFDSHLPLKPYGEGIVKKCDGLPLAIKAIGRLLSTRKNEEEYWKKVLDSEVWGLPVEGEILPALILSYYDLSACLKQLFAYCSLFPKDYLFNKEELVQLWMAEGFLHKLTPSDNLEECLGSEYFDELLSRSFFQQVPNNKSLFLMHDMMNDLAISIAGEFFLRLEKDDRKKPLENFRHLSFNREEYLAYNKFEAFKKAKSLRTFLGTTVKEIEYRQKFYLSNKILTDLIPGLPLLRVLFLSNFELDEVPESMGTLKHLRYLNLSQTKIKHLPESISKLYNLQTLILYGCRLLAKLPNSFLKLKNLSHFDITDTPLLKKMPLGIDELKHLQTLSKFMVEVEDGTELNKLKDLKNLSGKISVVGLEKVQIALHAWEANISQKRLSELEFVWSKVLDGSRNEMFEKEVLNGLKPSNECLKRLKIMSYGGLEFPNWIGDPSFLQLKHVSIRDCERCTILPPFGQLASLNELFLYNLKRVEVVGLELFGGGNAFSSLEILHFEGMRGWKKWLTNEAAFPCLKQLVIEDCPNLVEVTLETLPLLNVLIISSCPILVEVSLKELPSLNHLKMQTCDSGLLRRLVGVASIVSKLEISSISGLTDVVWRGVLEYLGALEELEIISCDELRYLWESKAVAIKILVKLKKLKVYSCNNLVSLGEKEEEDSSSRSNLFTSVKILDVYGCHNMERCICPDSIEKLKVCSCNSITTIFLPTRGQKLKSFDMWGCDKLLEREWGGQTMLESVSITRWPNLKSIIELNCLVRLTRLSVYDCKGLESLPDNELPSLTSLKHLEISFCPRMDACFPRGFWPPKLQSLEIGRLKKPISEWGSQNFPTSLVELHLDGGGEVGVSSCSQLSNLLPSSLTSLALSGFEKLESVSMGLQHLTSLQHLDFTSCRNLTKISHLQSLVSLQHLSFSRCTNLTKLSHLQHLASLHHLYFNSCTNLKDLSHLQHLPSLQHLSFAFCTNLKDLSYLQHLPSLQHLFFFECPNMIHLPEILLPSLLSLRLIGCPKLEERCSQSGSYWSLISHIPCNNPPWH